MIEIRKTLGDNTDGNLHDFSGGIVGTTDSQSDLGKAFLERRIRNILRNLYRRPGQRTRFRSAKRSKPSQTSLHFRRERNDGKTQAAGGVEEAVIVESPQHELRPRGARS